MSTCRYILAVGLAVSVIPVFSFSAPILGTGWTQDVFVEKSAANPSDSTTSGQYANYVVVEEGYAGDGFALLTGTLTTISNNIITTKNGTQFYVDPTVSNTIVDISAGNDVGTNEWDGTITLDTLARYAVLQFFVTGIGGNGTDTNFIAKLNFSDTATTYLGFAVKDWNASESYNAFDYSPPEANDKSAYLRRDAGATVATHVRELICVLSPADQKRKLTSIEFFIDHRLGVSGVSGIAPVVSTDDTGTWSGYTGPASDISIASFDASSSEKLVLCVSGENGNPNGLTDLTNVTYNGIALHQAVNRDCREDAYGVGTNDQSYSDIWYLDDPGTHVGSGTIKLYTMGNVRAIISAFALSDVSLGIGSTAVSDPESKSLELTTTEPSSLIIVSHALGGDGNSGAVVDIDPVWPLAENSAIMQGGNWNGQVTAITHSEEPGTFTYSFSGGSTVGANVVAIEILPPPPEGTVLLVR